MKPMHKLAGPAVAIGLALAFAAAPTSAVNAAISSAAVQEWVSRVL